MEKQKAAALTGKVIQIALFFIALVYVFVLVKIILLKSGFTSDFRYLQWIPFAFVKDFFTAQTSLDVVLKNVLGNAGLFLPFGILLPVFFKKLNFKKTLLCGFLLSLFFEVFQYVTGCGMSDIDDLILNTLGTAAGAGLYFGCFFRRKKSLRASVYALIFLTLFGIAGVAALWLFDPGSLPAQVEYENAEVFGDLDLETYDLSGYCSSVDGDTLILPSSYLRDDDAEEGTPRNIALSPEVTVFAEYLSSQYSPNGNIQKTTVRCESSTKEELISSITSEDGVPVDLWLDGSGSSVTVVVYVIYEN